MEGEFVKFSAFCFLLFSLSPAMSFSQEIYPLNIGDTWKYVFMRGSVPDPPEVHVAGDTIMPNGKTYKLFSPEIPYLGFTPQREEGMQVFSFSKYDSMERLEFDFSKSHGDTITSFEVGVQYKDTTDVILMLRDSVNLYGKWRKRWGFFKDRLRHAYDDESYVVIVEGIGINEIRVFGDQCSLQGAVINGITYGTLDAIDDRKQPRPGLPQLLQNYPNPFNPTTTIQFELAHQTYARLDIYNIIGQHISTLVDGTKPAGRYSVVFDGGNLPSGVYFYYLQAGNFSEAKKLLLAK
jgi:hypothetical protein